jgi:hypothetical protein
MAIQGFVLQVYSTMVSWTYILIIILLIAKLFIWITGGSLGKGWGGGGGGSGNSPGSGNNSGKGNNPNTNTRDENDPDPNNPESGGTTGPVRVVVQDISRNPIPGVLVKIYHQGDRSQNGFIRKFRLSVLRAPYQARTDNNGVADFGKIPSGNVIFELFKEGYSVATAGAMQILSVLRGKSRYFWSQRTLEKENEQLITFTLGREGEEAKGFEPHIERVQFMNNNDGQPVLNMTARVD